MEVESLGDGVALRGRRGVAPGGEGRGVTVGAVRPREERAGGDIDGIGLCVFVDVARVQAGG
ncbi:MAG: hypothetical protein DRH04_07385, partial [Deltaproteobacteria bacterium]